jgi:hypothetical protein
MPGWPFGHVPSGSVLWSASLAGCTIQSLLPGGSLSFNDSWSYFGSGLAPMFGAAFFSKFKRRLKSLLLPAQGLARQCSLHGLNLVLYACTVHAMLYLGYENGVQRPTATYGKPLYGQIISTWERNVLVVELWPFDFPVSAKQGSSVKPLAALWRPRVSGFMQADFGLSGLERVRAGPAWRWVAQRWLCEPLTFAEIERRLAGKPLTGEIRPMVRSLNG